MVTNAATQSTEFADVIWEHHLPHAVPTLVPQLLRVFQRGQVSMLLLACPW
jgi:hypothetical protein